MNPVRSQFGIVDAAFSPEQETPPMSIKEISRWVCMGMIALLSCTARTTSVVPSAIAMSDGFEVVVVEYDDQGEVEAARTILLKELNDRSAGEDQGVVKFPPSDAIRIESLLSTQGDGDSKVSIQITADDEWQTVQLSFHQSIRTYRYEYRVNLGDSTIQPISSSYRDLSKNSTMRYESSHEPVSQPLTY